MEKICIDIGHSTTDCGAINKAFNVTEYQFNSKLAPMIDKELKELGYNTEIVHRQTYSGLPKLINDTHADICISLHCNAANQIASGSEVLYWHSSSKGKQLAKHIQNELVDCLGLRDRGIKPLDSDDRGSSQLRKTVMPCVIIESGFIDNNVDYLILEDNIEELAKSIAMGIHHYFV